MFHKSFLLVLVGAFLSTAALADEPVAKPTCCIKHAYCCTIKATCYGKEATVNFEEKELTKEQLVAFAADRDTSLPICCMKKAYCCSIKSPCCGKELELEIVR